MSAVLTAAEDSPLAWVYPEIGLALSAVDASLQDQDWQAPGVRVGVLAHLHQVSGALHMVDLPAEHRLAAAIEAVVAKHDGLPPVTAIRVLRDAMDTLRAQLDRRLAGQPVRDLTLLPALQSLGACLGQTFEADALFFPDLASLPAGAMPDRGQVDVPALQAAAAGYRAAFQRGMLACLRGAPSPALHQAMVASLHGAATEVPGRFGPARWLLLANVLAACDAEALPAQRGLLARMDRQLRVILTTEDHPNDALVCSVLHAAAHLPAPGEALREILRQARVAELLAPAPVSPAVADPAHGRWQVMLQALLAAHQALEAWCHLQGQGAVPASVFSDLDEATTLSDQLGEDAAALLLEEAVTRLRRFPAVTQLADADLEPVVDILATLAGHARDRAAGQPREADGFAALRARLRSAVVPPVDAGQGRSDGVVPMPDLVAHAVREDLLGLFLDEAQVLLEALRAAATPLLGPVERPVAQAAVATQRGLLQTLRGSGLMAGLLPLAQLCRELDHLLATWTTQHDNGWQRPVGLVLDGALCLERWLARLAADRTRPLDALPLLERARALRAQPALRLAPLISLQDIFLEEAAERLQELHAALGDPGGPLLDVTAARRACHTLAGIARTAAHPGMAHLAQALEHRLLQWPGASSAEPVPLSHVRDALTSLQGMLERLQAGQPLQPDEALVRILHQDAVRAVTQPAITAPAFTTPAASMPAGTTPAATPPAGSFPATTTPLTMAPGETDVASGHPVAPASIPASVPAAAAAVSSVCADTPDIDLLPVFLEEAADLLPVLQSALQVWLAPPDEATSTAAADTLRRSLHTLKGSARMAGCLGIGERAHQLEDRLLTLAAPDASAGLAAVWRDTLQTEFDRLAAGIEALRPPAPGADGAALPNPAGNLLVEQMPIEPSPTATSPTAPSPTESVPTETRPTQSVLTTPLAESSITAADGRAPGAAQPDGPSALSPPPAAIAPAARTAGIPARSDPDGTAAAAPAPGTAPAPAPAPGIPPATPRPLPISEMPAESGQAVLRLKVELLDRMGNAAGEAGIARARAESEVQQLKRGLGDLVENIQRLKMQLRDIEIHGERAMPAGQLNGGGHVGFDPLEMDRYSRLQELTRSLGEGIDDVQTVQQGLKRGIDEMELALRQQGRVVRDLQQDLLRARMVPFASLSERLQRTVRQASRDAGRTLALQIDGAQHEIDRSILERLAAPLEHLLRNAAVHAIEDEARRAALGKPPVGQLRITLLPGDHEVQVTVSDDGRGIDLTRVRAQAEATGLLGRDGAVPGQGTAVEPRELLQLIFRSGFSTADSVTRLAGRGVGLDVVRSEVLGLGGRIHVDTREGAGTDFTLVIPVTLATVQAVVVRAGEGWFAIPAPLVEQIRAVNREEFARLYEDRAAVWQGLRYPLASLRRVLGQTATEGEIPGSRQLLFLRSADRRCALYVDELTGTQEIVVKAVSPHLARLPGIAGASVLGNGRIVLILDPVPLAVGQDGVLTAELRQRSPLQALPCVLVVDDSLTVRRVSSRLLERAGYQVMQAKDGVEALDLLANTLPDAVLLDVEMPRMDGFELVRCIRADARLRHLPLVVISSRTAPRHRQHAEQLGVQGYMGKPFRDDELLALLRTLLPLSQPAVTA